MGGGADGESAWPIRVRVREPDDLSRALRSLGVGLGRPVLVSVGGAEGMSAGDLATVAEALEWIAPVLDRWNAVVVDGGTDAGVMRVAGQVREATGAKFPLVGVAAEGTVALPGQESRAGSSPLESRHTHVIIVPGDQWGDESPWLSRVAAVIAGGRPSVTLVSNGGDITYADIRRSLEAGRPVIVLAGTGRAADAIADAAANDDEDGSRAAAIARWAGVTVVPAVDTATLSAALDRVLGRS
jgi:hypothetical protein